MTYNDLTGIGKWRGAPEHCCWRKGRNALHEPADDLCDVCIRPRCKVLPQLNEINDHWQVEDTRCQLSRSDVGSPTLSGFAIKQLVLR